MVAGARFVALRPIVDERGKVLPMVRATDEHFAGFGELYFSCAWPGVVKAWRVHSATMTFAVVAGHAKVVMHDLREDSPTHGAVEEHVLGEDAHGVVQVPPGVASGYKALGDRIVVVAVCASVPRDDDEVRRLDPFTGEIAYDWDLRHG